MAHKYNGFVLRLFRVDIYLQLCFEICILHDMQEDLKGSLMDKCQLIIITFKATREDLVSSLDISLPIFAPSDYEIFYSMKWREGNV